ncbi:hypothetical protein ACS0TY_004181 [Phlomoides rotata]
MRQMVTWMTSIWMVSLLNLLTHAPADECDNIESICKPTASGVKKKSMKRKSTDSSMHLIMEQLGEFLQSTESTLNGLAQRIGYEQDAKLSRTELFQIMNGIEGLTLKDKLKVSDELVRNTERLELFLRLPDDAKSEYVHMLLHGQIKILARSYLFLILFLNMCWD